MSELEENHTLVEIDNGKWRAKAKCRGTDTNIFFPTRAENGSAVTSDGKRIPYSKRRHRLRESDNQSSLLSSARILCVQCPVRKECLSYAMVNHIKHGIYGGKTPHDRRDIDCNDPNPGIPFPIFLKDLRRVRYMQDREHVSLAKDVSNVLNISLNAAEKMLRNNDYNSTFV